MKSKCIPPLGIRGLQTLNAASGAALGMSALIARLQRRCDISKLPSAAVAITATHRLILERHARQRRRQFF
jgi:hypothetical protein